MLGNEIDMMIYILMGCIGFSLASMIALIIIIARSSSTRLKNNSKKSVADATLSQDDVINYMEFDQTEDDIGMPEKGGYNPISKM